MGRSSSYRPQLFLGKRNTSASFQDSGQSASLSQIKVRVARKRVFRFLGQLSENFCHESVCYGAISGAHPPQLMVQKLSCDLPDPFAKLVLELVVLLEELHRLFF